MQACIKTIISQIDSLNRQRIDRALAAMDQQSQLVFHLIPTLLHYNHPTIPGYYNEPVPCGVYAFEENEIQQQFISQLSHFQSTPLNSPDRADILAIYTMGSTASFGQNRFSDLDIWVCISPSMKNDERSHLNNKCSLITEWAKKQGVEVNFFLMDEERFRNNHSDELSGDNCGSSQHLLLLDEFYRSAVRLAGQRILWQIVPTEMEACYQEYVDQLCRSGHINCEEWIDFGELDRIPAEEYFGSNLWQLYKSIDSPYKSALKAILLEAYSWEYPNTKLLSIESKKHFFAGDPNLYYMDSYYLILDKVTTYLEQTQDYTRLDLVRCCFYLKTHEKLSEKPETGSVKWRREALSRMISEWGWDDNTIADLDNQCNWKVEQVKKVHNALLDALMLSYRNLIQFARRNDITSAISPQDISILARKLYAAFEVLPGKVTLLNPQISPDLHESDLSFIQVSKGRSMPSGWYLYKQPLVAQYLIGSKSLEHNEYLSKLIAWSFFNGLITKTTRLHSVTREADINSDKFYQMVNDLSNTFSLSKQRPSMQALGNPCEISQLAMFINFENDPSINLNSHSLKMGVKNTDIFSFGENNISLVGSIDLVYRNSWHEVRTMHFTGETAILDALKTILGKMHQDALPPESVDVFCYSKNLCEIIQTTVYQILSECIEMRLQPIKERAKRKFKAIKIADQTFGLFFERRGVSVQKLENSIEFYRSISTNKVNGSPLPILNKGQEHHMPSVVDGFASEGLIQFFFEDTIDGFNIYVLDEENSVEVYHHFNGGKEEIVNSVNRFYTSNHQTENKESRLINFNLPQYYQIIHPRDEKESSYITPYRNDSCVSSKLSKAVNS